MLQSLSLMLNAAWLNAKSRLTKEDGAVDIVAIVVLIAIVVVIAILFRDYIADFIGNIFKSASENADNLNNPVQADKLN
ncbi:MAG: Flp1 family type IVb pilin [Lachnospiraceae bacterium]